MNIQISLMLSLITLTLLTPAAYAMETAVAAAANPPQSQPAVAEKTATKTWPPSFYDEPWNGAERMAHTHEELLALRKKATNSKKDSPEIASLSLPEKIHLDWIFTLNSTENHLMSKPFETWDRNDIRLIAYLLGRLSLEKPGTYRTCETGIAIIPPDEATKIRFEKALRIDVEKRTEEEHALVQEYFLLYPPCDQAEQLIGEALAQTQAQLKLALAEPDPETRRHAIIAVAVRIHFELVRISPFEDCSASVDNLHKRLGRLVMTILLHQHDIPRAIYWNRLEYNGIILGCIKAKSDANLLLFTLPCILRTEKNLLVSTKLEKDPRLKLLIDEILNGTKEEKKKGKKGKKGKKKQSELTITDLSKNEKYQALVEELTPIVCAGCQKMQPDGMRFKTCSRCKAIFYCSDACNETNWPNHKSTCKLTEAK